MMYVFWSGQIFQNQIVHMHKNLRISTWYIDEVCDS